MASISVTIDIDTKEKTIVYAKGFWSTKEAEDIMKQTVKCTQENVMNKETN